eukprot:5139372-Prymnesium_polylepis.1
METAALGDAGASVTADAACVPPSAAHGIASTCDGDRRTSAGGRQHNKRPLAAQLRAAPPPSHAPPVASSRSTA